MNYKESESEEVDGKQRELRACLVDLHELRERVQRQEICMFKNVKNTASLSSEVSHPLLIVTM